MKSIQKLLEQFRVWLIGPLPSVEMYKAMEKKQKERHDEILTLLHALEIQKQNTRPIQQQVSVQYVDWDQVQRLALKQLEDENKEN